MKTLILAIILMAIMSACGAQNPALPGQAVPTGAPDSVATANAQATVIITGAQNAAATNVAAAAVTSTQTPTATPPCVLTAVQRCGTPPPPILMPPTDTPVPTATFTSTPTATKTAVTTTTTTGSNPAVDDMHVYINNVQMGTVDPQMPKTHAAVVYFATGIGGGNTWVVKTPKNSVAIIGGNVVDGVGGGVYKAVEGGTTFTTTITNGFLVVTLPQWGEYEFNFRLSEAVQYCWDHQHVSPLPGWKVDTSQVVPTCNAPTASGTMAPTGARVTTGQNMTVKFDKGAEVWGWKIVLDSGKSCEGGDCYLASAPTGGTVISGVINPFPGEVPANVKSKPDWTK